jgi:two-component system, OmpR family, sensor histidine kinase KdpD
MKLVRWIAALAAIALITAAGVAARLNPSTVGFAYLIAVLLLSVWGGLLLGTISSVVAALCYNFFFFPPLYTLTIEEPANWFALVAFLIASVIVSRLVVAARVQAEAAKQRRMELETLYGLSIDLFTGAPGEAAQRALQRLGAAEGSVVLFDGDGSRQTLVAWRDDAADGHAVELPLVIGGRQSGTLLARGTTASRQALESAARLIALAVERKRLVEESAHLEALRESDALKTSLLRAISHDLTTPITAVTIRTDSIRRRAAADAELLDDIDAIAAETSRLRRRIDNLLAMARLEAGKARPHIEPTPSADLFRAARENLPALLHARPVTLHVDDDCPDANVDPSLALEILVNLIENAHRVSPPAAPIELAARRHPLDPARLRIEVLDRGPGLPPGLADVAQRGLGLEIARSLAAANDGSVELMPRPGGGTIARIDLPAALLPVTEGA